MEYLDENKKDLGTRVFVTKRKREKSDIRGVHGGRYRIRTCDPLIKSQMLYRLS